MYFTIISVDKLRKGDKYLIKTVEYNEGIFIKHKNEFAYFRIKHIYFKQLYYYVHKKNVFYEHISQKYNIQQAMELRAINIILRKIIGDPSFNYVK